MLYLSKQIACWVNTGVDGTIRHKILDALTLQCWYVAEESFFILFIENVNYWSYFSGCAYFIGKGWAREIMHQCPAMLLNKEEGRMKMELANMCGLLTSDFFLWHRNSGVPTNYLVH